MLGDEWYAGVVGSEVLNVVLAKGQAVAASAGGNGRRWRESVVRTLHACACFGEQGIESEYIGHDTSDVFQLITELGLIGVAAAIEWCTDDDRLRVGVFVCHREAAAGVDSRRLPVAADLQSVSNVTQIHVYFESNSKATDLPIDRQSCWLVVPTQ